MWRTSSVMKIAFAVLLALHGTIHFLGFVKAFGFAPIPQLLTPISRPLGLLWLAAALGFLLTAVLLFTPIERWWVPGVLAVVASQIAIVTSWSDAKFGTIPNVIAIVPLLVALLDERGSSLRSIYRSEVARGLARTTTTGVVTEPDLAPLPPLVQAYLRRVGVVGKPRLQNLRVHFRAEMRGARDAPWMPSRVEQVELFDRPTRLFFLKASRSGVPFDVLHVYEGAEATMRVRVAGLVEVVDARGPEMNQSETVTLFNDLCLLAPAALVSANVVWEPVPNDPRRVKGTYTNQGHTVSAELVFDASGDLVDFVSNDRYQSSADGKTFRKLPWSTPVSDYRDFSGLRLAAKGEAIWHEPEGAWTYGRFEIEDIAFNVGATSRAEGAPSRGRARRSGDPQRPAREGYPARSSRTRGASHG